jgi:hypothetical protein
VAGWIVPQTDNDGDGMPDVWEVRYLETLFNLPTDDEDGDGLSDGSEYVAGTHPKDAASCFRIKTFVPSAPSGAELRWDGVAGRTYAVLKSFGLVTNEWSVVSGDLPGSDGEMRFPAPTGAESGQCYRLQVTRP